MTETVAVVENKVPAVKNSADLKSNVKEKEIFDGLKVKVKTLNYGQQLELLSSIPEVDPKKNKTYYDYLFLLNTLKYVIVSVNENGKETIFTEPQQIEDYLKGLDTDVVLAFNSFYNEVLVEQEKKLDSIKKK